MSRITLSVFGAVICLIGSACGTKCTTGPGYRFPITCPGLLDSTKNHCCEISGSFRCCDEEEFARQGRKNDISKPPVLRNKRDFDDFNNFNNFNNFNHAFKSDPFPGTTYSNITTSFTEHANYGIKLGIAAILGIIVAVILPFVLCCACCCCGCCPLYHMCHKNDTHVTVIQPVAYNPGNNPQDNFCGAQANQSGMQQSSTSQPMQQAPPPYIQMEKTN